MDLHPEYVVDAHTNRKTVILPASEWEQILEELDELDEIRAVDEAISGTQDRIPFERAVNEIQNGYKA